MIPFVVLADRLRRAAALHALRPRRSTTIGLNNEAAHFSASNVERTKFILFVLAGAVSAFAGIYFTLRFGSARGDNATGLELQVIAAVLLGGVSIFGGRGALHGVIAGVLLIGVLASALRLEGVPSTSSTSSRACCSCLGDVHQRPGLGLERARPDAGGAPASPGPSTATGQPHRLGIGHQRKVEHDVQHSTAELALAAVAARGRAWRLTACGGDDDDGGGGDGGDGGGDADLAITFLPKNLGNPYFDTSDAGGEEAIEEFGGTYEEVGPDDRHARRAGAVHQHRGPAGRRRARRLGERPRGHLRRAQRGHATPASRSSRSTPTPNPECRDLFINQATAEGIAKVQVDLIAEQIGDEGEIAILSASANATNQNAWIELMEEELAAEPPEHRARRDRLRRRRRPDVVRQDRGAAADHPNLKGIISPTTVGIAAAARYLSTSEYKGKVALTGLGTPNQMREYVEDGTVKAFALWNPARPRLPRRVRGQGAGRG